MQAQSSSTDLSLLLLGAGGHGRVVADAALANGWRNVWASDRDPERCMGELISGIKLMALSSMTSKMRVHVSIGDNSARERESSGWDEVRLVSVVHPGALVSRIAEIGSGCFIAAGAVVAPCAQLGRGVIVNHGAVVDHDAVVGAFSHIAPGACLGGGAHVGERVLVGALAVVLPGVRVAGDSIIGAGAVVVSSIEVKGTFVGVPARRMA